MSIAAKRLSLGAGVALLVTLALAASAGGAVRGVTFGEFKQAQTKKQPRAYVAHEVLVRFRSDVRFRGRSNTLDSIGARVKRSLPVSGLKLVRLPAGLPVGAAIRRLERDPTVLKAEPNYIRQLLAVPNDPHFGLLWGLQAASDIDIDAPEAWNLTQGSAGVIVGVLDSGIDYNHPDLAPNMWTNPAGAGDGLRGWDYVNNDNDPMDDNGHGSHVAGTIGAQGNNNAGITGVNWEVSLMALKAANAAGSVPSAAIISGIGYGCAHGARVINGSIGGSSSSSFELAAIAAPACSNTLFVFAAGNGGRRSDRRQQRRLRHLPLQLRRPEDHLRGRHHSDGRTRGLLQLRRDERRSRRAGDEHPERRAPAKLPLRVVRVCRDVPRDVVWDRNVGTHVVGGEPRQLERD